MLLLSQLAGVALIVLVALDSFQTVLLPSARGWLNEAWVRLLWSGARILPTGIGRRARSSVGPLSIVATVASWVALLWVGYALIYLPDVDSLGYSSDVRFEGSNWVAALYLSGTALTTLGLGDVAAQTDGLRLLVVLESAGGLGIFTAALGYLPAIYTVVSELRTSAEAVSDLRATTPERAAALLQDDPGAVIEAVRRDVISVRQHLLRFPVLHSFHPPAEQSVLGVVEGATMLWAVARFGTAGERHPGVQRAAEALELGLRRLVDDCERHAGRIDVEDGRAAAQEQVEQVRRAVGQHDSDRVGRQEPDERALDDLARTNAVLRGYAAKHGYDFPSP